MQFSVTPIVGDCKSLVTEILAQNVGDLKVVA